MVARIRTVFTGVAGSPYYSNLYFSNGTDAEILNAVNRVRAFWNVLATTLRNGMSAQVLGEVVTIDPVTGNIIAVQQVAAPAAVNYTGTGDALPPQTQVMLTFNTGSYAGGRQVRGRCFIPGWTETANQVDGTLTGSYPTDITTAAATMRTGAPAQVVWSRKNGTIVPVTGASVARKWATLKTRRD